MMEQKSTWKKYVIGTVIVSIIVLLIIWYRNSQRNKLADLSKTKLTNSNVIPVAGTDIGKTLVVKGISADLYNLDSTTFAYTKYNGQFVGDIVADKTDSGNLLFYKVINSNGDYLYVLKTNVKIL